MNKHISNVCCCLKTAKTRGKITYIHNDLERKFLDNIKIKKVRVKRKQGIIGCTQILI